MSIYEEMDETRQFACRVIADHARSTAFAIADGILPGNEGRNYVLRKIMRRAIYHGREHLGLTDAFFYKVCDRVVDEMRDAFPELETQREFISKMVRLEEDRFANTVTVGLGKLFELFRDDSFTRLLDLTFRKYKALGKTNEQELAKYYKKEIRGLKERREERFGTPGDLATILARLVFENKLPPSVTLFLVKSEYPDDELDKTRFGLELGQLLSVHGSPREKEIGRLLKSSGDFRPHFDTLDALYEDILAFKKFAHLYDTYGTPRDLIRVYLEGQGRPIDEQGFNDAFEIALQQLQKQSGIGKTERKSEVSPVYAEVLESVGKNVFHGYEETLTDGARVLAILDGDAKIDELAEGSQGSVILDQTPFYAESGGQVGDVGTLSGPELRVIVTDTYSPVAGLIIHKVKVDKGTLKVGDTVTASVNVQKRDATRRNHTATHLVHAALKEVLGSHVKQAGSVVAPGYLRFDFAHYQPLTAAEIAEVEDLVNREILQNEPVTTNLMAIEEAMRSGAVAMFGEKYGSEVRVLSVGDGKFSKELCGGTHVRATGDIGAFKITSDEAIASGVRRIRAITGFDAYHRFREDELLIDRSLAELNTQRDNLPNAIARLQDELKRTRKEMDELKLKIATGSIGSSANGDEARDVAGIKVLAKIVDGLDANGTRQLSDTLLARLKSGVVVLGRSDEGKVGLIVRVSSDLTNRLKAGDIIREIAPIVGGRGGGKPDMAEGGGTDPSKLDEAIETAHKVIENFLA